MKNKKKQNLSIYQKYFSRIYDHVMNKKKYDSWKIFLSRVIDKFNIPRGMALDLGCGTGEISRILLELNFSKVVGLDLSKYMLQIAIQKLYDFHKNGRFLIQHKNMLKINEKGKYDLIVSFYDSLNYILSLNELSLLFKKIEGALKDGGFFVFDVITPEHVSYAVKKPPAIFHFDFGDVGFYYGKEDDLWKIDIEIKFKNGKTIKEIHFERGYSYGDVLSILTNTSLKLLDMKVEYKTINDVIFSDRMYFILKKVKNF